MNEVLHRAIARINKELEMAVVIEDERETEELKITKAALKKCDQYEFCYRTQFTIQITYLIKLGGYYEVQF